jgi:protein-disulfide isomerase
MEEFVAKKKAVRKPDAGSRKMFGVLIGVVALAGVGTLGYVLSQPRASSVLVAMPAAAGSAETGVGHLEGRADAPVQVMEFGDFECPHCAEFALVTEPDIRTRLISTGIVAFRYFDFPLSGFEHSWTAHIAASCAEDQGKFWEMHDRLYSSQDEWNSLGTNNPVKVMTKFARDIGLDVDKWTTCVTTQATAARVRGNQAEGMRRNFKGTPTLFIGKRMFSGAATYDQFKANVDSALADYRADSVAKAKSGAKKP